MERLKSPVVWGVVITVIVAQLEQLRNIPNLSGWDIAISVFTVLLAVFGAINNPSDRDNF